MIRAAYIALLLFLFATPWSLPLGRAMLALSTLLVIIKALRGGSPRLGIPTSWFLMVVCVAWTYYCTKTGINPHHGLPRFPKLLWFLGILAPATLLRRPHRLWEGLSAFALGTGILAFKLVVEHSADALARRDKFHGDLLKAIIDLGSMTDGQRLMIGMIATLGVLLAVSQAKGIGFIGRIRRIGPFAMDSRWFWAVLLLAQTGAFIFNFKRGSWICGAIVLGSLVLMRLGRRGFVAFCVAVALIVALPQTRVRLSTLGDEFTRPGGRWSMWTKIAPALVKEHLWKGVGYRSLGNDALRKIDPHIERFRDHLHSNPVEFLVDTGIIGFILYTLWFSRVGIDIACWWRRTGPHPTGHLAALIVGAMYVSLLLNGLVEYNFGDAEIVLGYIFIMGASAAGANSRLHNL